MHSFDRYSAEDIGAGNSVSDINNQRHVSFVKPWYRDVNNDFVCLTYMHANGSGILISCVGYQAPLPVMRYVPRCTLV